MLYTSYHGYGRGTDHYYHIQNGSQTPDIKYQIISQVITGLNPKGTRNTIPRVQILNGSIHQNILSIKNHDQGNMVL